MMAPNRSGPGDNRAADQNISKLNLPANDTTSSPLQLIVRAGGHVLCMMTVPAEPLAGGLRFEGFIPWRAMP